MIINTISIINSVEVELNKGIDKVLEEDLKNVKTININRMEFSGDLLDVDYNDILYFENLEVLNINRCMINDLLMNNIIQLKKLKRDKF